MSELKNQTKNDIMQRFEAEVCPMIQKMPPDFQEWWVQYLRELTDDLKAEHLLKEALPEWEHSDPWTWRPSTPPPGVTRETYQLELRALMESEEPA